jgi:DNA-binding NarL/FixJ family response regulator
LLGDPPIPAAATGPYPRAMLEPTRPCRIAIADDSPAFVSAVTAYIAQLPGYVLAGKAAAAADAVALVAGAAPDLLLLDLGSAPARAVELIRTVKALSAAPAVVAMTLFHTPEAEAAAMRAGAHALLGKESFVAGLTAVLAGLFPEKVAA